MVILQTSGCKASVNPLALSDHSDSRKRSRTSLPASGVGGRSVAGFYTRHSIIAQVYYLGEQQLKGAIFLTQIDIKCFVHVCVSRQMR